MTEPTLLRSDMFKKNDVNQEFRVTALNFSAEPYFPLQEVQDH